MNPRSKIIRLSLVIFILACVLLGTIRAQSGPTNPKADFFIPIFMHAWPPPTPTPRPGAVLITEIQYDAIGAEPDQEWIELYNPGDLPYLLTNVWLGDEETLGGTEGMFRFPNGTLLNARQIIVIANRASAFVQEYGRAPDFELVASDVEVPDLIKDKQWATGNIELTNNSDEVLLRDISGVVIDGVSWGNTSLLNPPAPRVASGHSLERRPAFIDSDMAIDWKDQPFPNPWEVDTTEPTSTPRPTSTPQNTDTPTPSLTQLPFGNERLLLTEVLYNPLGANPEEEWFEVYNSGSGPANLYDYKIGDEETIGQGEGMMRFPPGSFLLAGKVAVIANQAVSFYSNYGFYPDFELVNTDSAIPDLVGYDTWARGSINLNQSGDELLLLNKNDQVQDSLSWGNSTWAFTPGIPEVLQGHSLARIPANEDTDQACDWHDQSRPDPRQIDLVLPTAIPTPTDTSTPTSTSTPSSTPADTPEPPPVEAGRLLLSEVKIETDYQCGLNEWIELVNVGGQAFDLTGYQVGDEETAYLAESMFYFPAGASLEPGEVILVAKGADVFSSTYGILPDFELIDTDPNVPDLIPNVNWATGDFCLNLSGDEVLILGPGMEIIDLVSWGQSPLAFDPLLPSPPLGSSLERCPTGQDTDSAADWRSQPSPSPGTLCSLPPP